MLVVIGILIALQINAWNQDRINTHKEEQFLNDLNENLNEDLESIKSALAYNKTKFQAIDSAFHYMSLMKDNKQYGRQFSNLFPILSNNVLFSPSRVTFEAIISTGQIEIIKSVELRKQLAKYYADTSLDGVQEQLKRNTQSFLDVTTPKMINKEMTKFFTKRDFDVIPLEELTIHKDSEILSKLFVMLNKTREHNKRLNEMQSRIDHLQNSINLYVNSKF